MKYADEKYPIDIIDIENAKMLAKKIGIDGVMTMQSDLPIPTVGAIIDFLKLPGNGFDVSVKCSDKRKTRELFAKNNVPQPKFQIIRNIKEAEEGVLKIGLPCIIKAVDSSGSRGVVKVNAEKDIKKAFLEAKKYTRTDSLLIEEYVDGLEIGAQSFSVNGKCIKVLVHNDTVSTPPYMVPVGHSFPYKNPDELNIIEEAVKKAVDALGIKEGPANIDLIVSKNKTPMIIEIGARIGATCLPELVEYYTGIDWVKSTIDIALGNKPDLMENKNIAVAAVILESPKDGVFEKAIIPEEVNRDPNLIEVEVTAKNGEIVNRLTKGTDRIGKVIVKGNNVFEAEKLAEQIKKKIIIEVK
eukprot:Anaeramoba_ignava/a487178_11.p1 GENE.a487178_11~~a487178_11.p1  ORF type:complete len:356 (+),score=62.05 a487178_11:1-1068(+)